MSLQLLNYYIFKDSLKQISGIDAVDINNQMLFKYALFYNATDYYKLLNPFKKDPYQISKQLKSEKGVQFIRACMEEASKNENPDQKLFCYFIAISRCVELHFLPYIEAHASKIKTKYYWERMIDSYYFHKNEKMSITKVNLADYFYDSFELSKDDFQLIHTPMKRIFGFFCTEQYYKHCYEQAAVFFHYFARSKTGLKKIPFFFYDIFLNHRKGKRKASTFLYHRKIDTTVLNLSKQEYEMDGQIKNLNCDEVYQQTLKDIRLLCSALNSYFDYDNIKPFFKYYHLPLEK